MTAFFFCGMVGLMLGFFIHHSNQGLRSEIARLNRQLQAIAEAPSFVELGRLEHRNVRAIKIVKDATGFGLPETVDMLKQTPCRIPFIFQETEALQMVKDLRRIGVEASAQSLQPVATA